GFGLDEVRVLISLGERFGLDLVTADFLGDRLEILSRRDDLERSVRRAGGQRQSQNRASCRVYQFPHESMPRLSIDPTRPTSEHVGAMRADRKQELEQELVGIHAFGVPRVAILPANLAELARPVSNQR